MLKKDQVLYWLPVLYDAYIGHKGFYVIGYTKSGTNWLKNMLRHYYGFKLPARYTPGKPFLDLEFIICTDLYQHHISRKSQFIW